MSTYQGSLRRGLSFGHDKGVTAEPWDVNSGAPVCVPRRLPNVVIQQRHATNPFEWPEKAYHERSDLLICLKGDQRLDPIRNDPRLKDLVARIRIP
jgi:hypothetical protein